MILLLISFIAGVLTILAPCVLPLLPVIVGGSLVKEEAGFSLRKTLTIIVSLGVSVLAFTFILKVSTLFIAIPEYVWQYISGIIIVVLGIFTLFPSLYETQFMAKMSARSNILLGSGYRRNNFWGDVIIGAALGPVFSTCSPTYFFILATVLPVSLFVGIIYLLAYVVGLCGALLVVAYIGQKIADRLGALSDPHSWLKKALGILFIVVGLLIVTGIDKKIETAILENGFFDVTKIEQKLRSLNDESTLLPTDNSVENGQLNQNDQSGLTGSTTKQVGSQTGYNPQIKNLPKAPELVSPNGYINTDGQKITLSQYKGKKVVLVDFWTYSCINCQRTLPYLKNWYEKYKDQGLEIIGVHTPEFAFEKLQKNVENAVREDAIKYPVILDNNYATWNAFKNQYWPRKYLVDIDGYIVYDHIGEGSYEETEQAIQKALMERANRLGEDTPKIGTVMRDTKAESGALSPEVYFGYARNEYLQNGKKHTGGQQSFTFSGTADTNKLYLDGDWNIASEYAESVKNSRIIYRFQGKQMYMVASAAQPTDVQIKMDGKVVRTIKVSEDTLYTIVSEPVQGEHTIELDVQGPGLKVYTFTFGNM